MTSKEVVNTTTPEKSPVGGDFEANQAAIQAYHDRMLPLYRPVLSCPWPRREIAPLDNFNALEMEQLPLWQAAVAALPQDPGLLQQLAGELIKSGRQGEGLALYRQLLAANPSDPQRHSNLAGALLICGNAKEAEAIWRHTLNLDPTWQTAKLSLAHLLLNEGRLDEAKELYQSLELDSPENFSRRLACAFLQASDAAAPEHIQRDGLDQLEALVAAAQSDPARFRALLHRLVGAGQLDRALQLLKVAPIHEQAWGWELEQLELLTLAGDIESQRDHIENLLISYPDLPEIAVPIGVLLLTSDPNRAIKLFIRILEIDHERLDAWGNLALAYEITKEKTKAIDAHLNALLYGADAGPVHYNFGNQYCNHYALAEAQACFCKAILLCPFSHDSWMALGNVLHHQRHHGPDLLAMRRIQTFAPKFVMGRLSLGLALLMYQQFDEGWSLYEARLDLQGAIWLPKGLEKWDGVSEIDELLIVAEQGVGDVIQFMRYSILLGLGIPRVTILAEPKYHTLLHHYGGFAAVHSVHEPYRVLDNAAWYPMASLLGLLGINNEAVIINAPYLTTESQSATHWSSLLQSQPGNKLIGLNWQGNPNSEESYFRGRSFPLDTYAPLAALQGFELISLQKGPGSEQLETCSFRSRFLACQAEIDQAWDFVETLSILQACDLVITSDTSVAHLAGALGRPTWLLLKYMPDWRWGLEGTTSPWYPTLRLFRQKSANDWVPVIAEIQAALEVFIKGSRATSLHGT